MAHYVILGAGECGARAAFALREKGFAGEITLVGAEPLPPYERPPLSKAGSTDASDPKFIAAAEKYIENGIRLLTGLEARDIDPASRIVTLSDGTVLSYDKLLLATGAAARSLPGAPVGSRHIRSLRTHHDAAALREAMKPGRHIAIIGGGFIGLELAATARLLGAEVTVIEGLERVLKRGVPEEIAHLITERHRAEGVDIRCGVSIEALTAENGKALIRLSTGEVIEADLVLVGIGARPNVEIAERAGLAIDNGIAVDTYLRTSAADVFAAGDCCSFPLPIYGGRRVRLESWRNAQEQGTLAAANMLGFNEAVSSVPWFWSDQYDMTLQISGLAEGAAMHQRRDLGAGAFILFHLDADGRLIAASGIGPGNAVARDIRLAEMLISARAHPNPAALAASDIKLKSLLAA
ncbi:NAD(P)/FAD-dependent oxidoreductase [Rhizobium ruizarguesonis]|jgi:3-phenylpropionate/trans-cinnamate dioxygenase ferredoxin reductase subunit|uniref:NAD(P)/FAD-dependent oxidoreductase n=1 Tax=Rhizobium ruizarguesonis TaxID=2081791 RepID=UPI001031B592|nr:FAD-dependent oxidoreductase [Rhizobium ruizarguesonis]TBY57154.1 ferredoxin reductase [Rhizobium leguminosarum bv. viciae]TAT96229.1 ferredoxin reductase [Rhizobium ruizarguesonis]TBA52138.1 ferredoxin reductase [Rhizobium ruizarguesonis]TBA76822.1 ferredoxin reductase [Rhizobium ruizarguesonis]TBA96096.1 ferredoxin reductase [Rhizobium ruizarguesonis]